MLKRGEEVRVTDPSTGGEKGAKPERFSLIPFDAMDEILRGYTYGADKYSPHNWRRGYKWSLSFDALMRHLTAWWEGEDRDKESGLNHLAHAAWHCIALLWFQLNDKGTDDRYKPDAGPVGQEVFVPGSIRNQDGLGRVRGLDDKLLSHEEMEERAWSKAFDQKYDTFMEGYDPVTRTWFSTNFGGK